MNSQPRFMNAAAVPQAYGISRRTLARREKDDPQFPKAHRLSRRLVVFEVAALDDYFRGKAAIPTKAQAQPVPAE